MYLAPCLLHQTHMQKQEPIPPGAVEDGKRRRQAERDADYATAQLHKPMLNNAVASRIRSEVELNNTRPQLLRLPHQ